MEKLGNANIDRIVIDMVMNTSKTFHEIADELNINVDNVLDIVKGIRNTSKANQDS